VKNTRVHGVFYSLPNLEMLTCNRHCRLRGNDDKLQVSA
jgi:hypothetical protein